MQVGDDHPAARSRYPSQLTERCIKIWKVASSEGAESRVRKIIWKRQQDRFGLNAPVRAHITPRSCPEHSFRQIGAKDCGAMLFEIAHPAAGATRHVEKALRCER